eukprot:5692957-Prymnesium_polylepis.1
MNSAPTAPADRLQRSAAQQNGLRNPPPTAALPLVAREATERSIGPTVSTPRTGAPKSGRPR